VCRGVCSSMSVSFCESCKKILRQRFRCISHTIFPAISPWFAHTHQGSHTLAQSFSAKKKMQFSKSAYTIKLSEHSDNIKLHKRCTGTENSQNELWAEHKMWFWTKTLASCIRWASPPPFLVILCVPFLLLVIRDTRSHPFTLDLSELPTYYVPAQ
jgi:hypothetical protein